MKVVPHLFAFAVICTLHAELPPDSPVLKQLRELKAGYDASVQNEVTGLFDAATADLKAKYAAALDRAKTAATQAGQLETAVALRDEQKRVVDGEPVPADDSTAPEALKKLRQTYRTSLAALETRREQTAAPIRERYGRTLQTLEVELTKAGNLEAAVKVRGQRENLAKPDSPTPVSAAEKQPALITSPDSPPSSPGGSTAVSVENLADRRLIFGMDVGRGFRAYSQFTLLKEGRILGSLHPNETSWSVDAKERLLISDRAGKPTTILDTIRWKDGRVSMEGPFQLKKGVTHRLSEVVPAPPGMAKLSGRKIGGMHFVSCDFTPDAERNSHVLTLEKNGSVAGSKLVGSPVAWEVDARGCLLFKDAGGNVTNLYDRAFTFLNGKFLMLEGPNQIDTQTSNRLIERGE